MSKEVAQITGQTIGTVVGDEMLIRFWLEVGSLLQEAYRTERVVVYRVRELKMAAAGLLTAAGLLEHRGWGISEEGIYLITDKGRQVAKRVFHLE